MIYSKATWMWHLETEVSGGLGSTRGMVGLDGLGGLFQSKCFLDPTVLCIAAIYEVCTFLAITNCSPYSKGHAAV